ncbi:replicative DNA helicase [Oscillochloris sp. ZM17-4]|uniref:replicative DNA helicase n=1 Tax=Oscillochloris sp. ZM17-4 TaxID=2866714 RepID=UPI001C7311C5|nr:replicative DNA helicase [Oscillochloris sp. ZM17-4]MBX0328782.1 replicative DNA helicase [Oscillochloris sp. ZM17-4]
MSLPAEPALRSVPCDLDAERATLGAILLDREAIIAVAPFLTPAHFYLEKHAQIYAAMLACYGRREPPDLTTVSGELRRQGQLEGVGGASVLGELLAGVPTAVHVEYYARSVERTAVGRALIEAGGQIVALGYDDALPIEERLDAAAQRIFQLSSARQLGQDFVSVSTVASEYLDALAATADEGDLLGIGAGYPDLDRITQGMKPGELVVLAARPGVGKTALALCIAYHVAQRGQHVGIFSLEMDRELLLQRLIALELRVPTNQVPRLLRRGDHAAIAALARVAELPIHIDHTPSLNVLAIRDRARRLASAHPIELWVVDYLQLAQGASARDDEVKRITAVSQGLTSMAREFRVPVLALSQLSRAVESRAAHVPMLSDLRGSGSIEQDASQVWFIYREELYDDPCDRPGVAEIHVAKHRNGETGVASLRFEHASTRFVSLSRAMPSDGR